MRRREFNESLALLGLNMAGAFSLPADRPEPLRFTQLHYETDGRPAFLYSGEFHYFRVPRADWRKRMDLFKAAGGNAVATYIPWVIHEPEEGTFVFGGAEPYRDFEGFLETAQEAGLYVIARPGPYSYSELNYSGLPGWLCENYPQLRARTLEGKLFPVASISYLHPLFMEKCRTWYSHVCPLIARHTVSHGGPIVLAQVDNELTGMHVWFGGLDYNAETMGFGKPEGRYPRFLRRRYASLRQMNEAYRTDFPAFESVCPLASSASGRAEEVRRLKDYFDFYLATIAEYAKTLSEWMGEYGIDVPRIHNSANPDMDADFLETIEAMGPNFLLGSDHYYNLDQGWSQNNPTPQWAVKNFCSLEMLRLMGFPPTVLELPGGSPSDWPPITSEDSRAGYWTNLAFGMKGSNIYVFTGGKNPPDVGSTDGYDYNAAIGANNEIRPLYGVQKELGLFLKARPWLADAEREADCRFALDFEMARSENYWKQKGEFLLHGAEAWGFFLKGALTSALCASLSPVLCDLGSDAWVADRTTPVLVVSCSAMAREKQQRLIRFLEQGGRVLLAPMLPAFDDRLRPCTILRDFLGGPVIEESQSAVPRVTIAGLANIFSNGGVYPTVKMPAGAQGLGIEKHSGKVVAWHLTTDGGGQVIVLGFRWQHSVREHDRMLKALLERLGLEQKVSCSNPAVWTSLRTNGDRSIMFLMNLFSAPMEADVSCRVHGKWVALGRQKLDAMSVKHLEL